MTPSFRKIFPKKNTPIFFFFFTSQEISLFSYCPTRLVALQHLIKKPLHEALWHHFTPFLRAHKSAGIQILYDIPDITYHVILKPSLTFFDSLRWAQHKKKEVFRNALFFATLPCPVSAPYMACATWPLSQTMNYWLLRIEQSSHPFHGFYDWSYEQSPFLEKIEKHRVSSQKPWRLFVQTTPSFVRHTLFHEKFFVLSRLFNNPLREKWHYESFLADIQSTIRHAVKLFSLDPLAIHLVVIGVLPFASKKPLENFSQTKSFITLDGFVSFFHLSAPVSCLTQGFMVLRHAKKTLPLHKKHTPAQACKAFARKAYKALLHHRYFASIFLVAGGVAAAQQGYKCFEYSQHILKKNTVLSCKNNIIEQKILTPLATDFSSFFSAFQQKSVLFGWRALLAKALGPHIRLSSLVWYYDPLLSRCTLKLGARSLFGEKDVFKQYTCAQEFCKNLSDAFPQGRVTLVSPSLLHEKTNTISGGLHNPSLPFFFTVEVVWSLP